MERVKESQDTTNEEVDQLNETGPDVHCVCVCVRVYVAILQSGLQSSCLYTNMHWHLSHKAGTRITCGRSWLI